MKIRGRQLAYLAALMGGAVALAGVIRARRAPSACPYSQRLVLELPRPFLGRERLRGVLEPLPGERVLEVGPGSGYYALHTAQWIAPGELHALDLQQEMLDLMMRRARERDITNIYPQRGDARELPYADASFDAAYLVATLGEVEDQDAALRELRRVLKVGGRLVVGESLPDPHMVPFGLLRSRAEAAGFRFQRMEGSSLGYLALFRAG